MNKYIEDYKIKTCICSRDICDEWNLELEAYFKLVEPQVVALYEQIHKITDVVLQSNYYGMDYAATTIPDLALVKFVTDKGRYIDCFEIPDNILKEIADIFKNLEDKNAKELNGCIISDEIYNFINHEEEE